VVVVTQLEEMHIDMPRVTVGLKFCRAKLRPTSVSEAQPLVPAFADRRCVAEGASKVKSAVRVDASTSAVVMTTDCWRPVPAATAQTMLVLAIYTASEQTVCPILAVTLNDVAPKFTPAKVREV
jgi:hypothetical protein